MLDLLSRIIWKFIIFIAEKIYIVFWATFVTINSIALDSVR